MAGSLLWTGCIDTRRRDPVTARLLEDSLTHGRRIEDSWRQAFLLAQH